MKSVQDRLRHAWPQPIENGGVAPRDIDRRDIDAALGALARRFQSRDYLFSDPVQFVHRYAETADQEVAGWIASLFSYGAVPQILKAVDALLSPLGASPSKALRSYSGERLWPGFYYRFHREEHVVVLMLALSGVLGYYGSLEAYFSQAPSLPGRFDFVSRDFKKRCFEIAERRYGPAKSKTLERGFKFLLNSPFSGSACKRMCMYARWMVRKDEIDVGIWKSVRPEDLVMPIDTHVARLSHYLQLRSGAESRAPDWKMAEEITARLAEARPADPIAFDFALTRLGILDLCERKYEKSVCERCPIMKGCLYARGH